jgi:drug/metabolite transporter (DMT)-like permease
VTTPVIALALSTLFEGYRWTWVGGLGVLLAIAGNTLALRPPGARRRFERPGRPETTAKL